MQPFITMQSLLPWPLMIAKSSMVAAYMLSPRAAEHVVRLTVYIHTDLMPR